MVNQAKDLGLNATFLQAEYIENQQPLGPAQDGYVLTYVDAAKQLELVPSTGGGGGSPTGPAGGNLSGTYPNPLVVELYNATVPSGTGLTTGNVLQVSGASALSYDPVNVGGGTNYITGIVPAANLPAATTSSLGIIELAGDIYGTATDVRVKYDYTTAFLLGGM